MPEKSFELRKARDIGEIIDAYIKFLKLNFNPFFAIFLRYNSFFAIGFIAVSYFLVSGYWNLIFFHATDDPFQERNILMGMGLFLVLMLVTSILNYSLAASYMAEYVKNKGEPIDRKNVFESIRKMSGNIFLFILLMGVIYIGVFIVSTFAGLIPLFGILIYFVAITGYRIWMGISFMAMFYAKSEVTDSFSIGWQFTTSNFIKSVLSHIVLGLLLGVMALTVMMVPGYLVGIISYFSTESLADSVFYKILWIIIITVLIVSYLFFQILTQFINGVLFFSFYEEKNNEAARERIEQIGIS